MDSHCMCARLQRIGTCSTTPTDRGFNPETGSCDVKTKLMTLDNLWPEIPHLFFLEFFPIGNSESWFRVPDPYPTFNTLRVGSCHCQQHCLGGCLPKRVYAASSYNSIWRKKKKSLGFGGDRRPLAWMGEIKTLPNPGPSFPRPASAGAFFSVSKEAIVRAVESVACITRRLGYCTHTHGGKECSGRPSREGI